MVARILEHDRAHEGVAASADAATPGETTTEAPPAASTRGGVHIEDILGSRTGRFFGEGYRHVVQHITELAWEDGGPVGAGPRSGRRANGFARVDYPSDWSCKNGIGLIPHVSTIDALALSFRLLDTFLVNGYRNGAMDVSRAWLRRFVMKSGATPHHDLGRVGLRITELGRVPNRPPAGWRSAVFECEVGNIRVRCELEHENDLVPRYAAQGALAPSAAPYYSAGYRNRVFDIADVRIDAERRSVSASAHHVGNAMLGDSAEIGSGYQPSLTLLDSSIVLAQLGQALVYSLDELSRSETGTLWMRKVDMWQDSPHQPLSGPLPCTTQVERSSIVDLAGARWRASNLTGAYGNSGARYSVAHRLSESHVS
jgi:hypothetical protein